MDARHIILVAMFLFACTPSSFKAEPSHMEVQRGIKKGIIFGLIPDENGKLQSCRVARTVGFADKMDETFRPSQAFIEEACAKFKQAKMAVDRDNTGKIKEVYYVCSWSEVEPNKPLC